MADKNPRFGASKHNQRVLPSHFRLRRRDYAWLILVVICAIGWFTDHQRAARYKNAEQLYFRKAVSDSAELTQLREHLRAIEARLEEADAISHREAARVASQPQKAR